MDKIYDKELIHKKKNFRKVYFKQISKKEMNDYLNSECEQNYFK